jgi:hypothetical protein
MSDYSHHFSVENIPFGIASSQRHENAQCVTRIENSVIFLQDLAANGPLTDVDGLPNGIFSEATLNRFAALPKSVHHNVRKILQQLHSSSAKFPEGATEDISEITMHLPVSVGDFTGMKTSHCIMNRTHMLRESRLLMQSDPRQECGKNCHQRRKATSSILSPPRLLCREGELSGSIWYTNSKTNWTIL